MFMGIVASLFTKKSQGDIFKEYQRILKTIEKTLDLNEEKKASMPSFNFNDFKKEIFAWKR